MSRRRVAALVLLCMSAGVAAASPITARRLHRASGDANTYLVDGRYLRGEAHLTAMHDSGELPDTIPDGQCRFDLAGDPGVAYYVRSCP